MTAERRDQQPENPRGLQTLISRRRLLGGSAVGGAAIAGLSLFETVRLGLASSEQNRIWNLSNASFESLMQSREFGESLRTMSMGCSFSPEQFGVDLVKFKKDGIKGNDAKKAMDGIRFAVEELGMKEIRFGIRWRESVDDSGNIDLSFYEPYLRYCLQNGVRICLNVGPIKTFRWPEEHLPEKYLKRNESGSVIGIADGISQQQIFDDSVIYLKRLLPALSQLEMEATSNISNAGRFVAIQPENEAFNQFGQLGLRITPQHLKTVVEIVSENFPDRDILLNSPGNGIFGTSPSDMKHFIGSLDARYRQRIRLGYDYYYRVPNQLHLFEEVDSNSRLEFSSGIFSSPYAGINEITEMQAEPWGSSQKPKDRQFQLPGNDSHDFKFALLRSLQALGKKRGSLVRMWGIEHLAYFYIDNAFIPHRTKAHEEIVGMIKILNGIS